MKKTLRTQEAMKLVLCGCGKIHVTWGSITLHFMRDEFQAFAESIRRLAAIMTQPSANEKSPATTSSFSEVCH